MPKNYYDILPCDKAYHGTSLLTYSSSELLKIGQIVVVKIRTKTINGFVIKKVQKPKFNTKNIEYTLPNIVLPPSLIKTMSWLHQYYPDNLGVIGSLFSPTLNKNNISPDKIITTNLSKYELQTTQTLSPTNQQAEIISDIIKSQINTHILHGDTGTGKTYIYRKLCEQILLSGKSAIVLTPEISLTPQLVSTFSKHFKYVYLVHSKQTIADRRNTWLKILNSTEPVVLIGPRSCLFYPIQNLGLIIIDEFHEKSYKQEQSPHYNALRVAGYLSKTTSSKLVMGSATPPIEEYFYAVKNGAKVHRLTEKPYSKNVRNNVLTVDLTLDKEKTSQPLLSKSLLKTMRATLLSGQQVLLFLNKRGSSRLILCQKCGWSAECVRCNIPYVYHHDTHSLICHICSQKKQVPTKCLSCNDLNIIFKNPGTKQIELAITRLFPEYKIGRYDKDNKKNETFIKNYSDIANGKIDILIGTQTLTKGHDLPHLGLVAVLSADSSLNFPDYSANEKTFQILHQAAGRVGRHGHPGTVILQSFSMLGNLSKYVQPDKSAWINFYTNELKQRQKYNFPPFCFILKIEVKRKSNKSAQEFIQKIYIDIAGKKHADVDITPPTHSFIAKKNDYYSWQIVVRSKSRKVLLSIIKTLPTSCTYDIDPSSLL